MLDAKLAQQMYGLVYEPLLQVFLYVRNSYDSLERERCLGLLRGYGMIPNLSRLLKNYWKR